MGRLNQAVSSARRGGQRAERVLLSVLAANSILWRSLPEAVGSRVSRLLDILVDGAVGAFISVTITTVDLRLLGVGIDVLFYLYLIYRIIPRFLPNQSPAANVVGTDRFAAAASILVLTLAYPISAVLPGLFSDSPFTMVSAATGLPLGAPEPLQLATFLLVWVGIVWLGIALYVYLTWWRIAPVEARMDFMEPLVAGYVDVSDRSKARHQYTQGGALGHVNNAAAILGTTSVLVFPLAVFGVLTGIAVVLFPLPEFIVLAAALAGGVFWIRPTWWLSAVAERRADFEEQFVGLVRCIQTTDKGVAAAGFVSAGLAFSMVHVLLSNIAVVAVTGIAAPESWVETTIQSPLRLWVFLLLAACLVIPGFYSFWFWLRQTARLPHYLIYWDEKHADSPSLENEDWLPALSARPPGVLIVPSLLFIPVIVFIKAGAESSVESLLLPLAVIIPGLLILVAATIRWTFQAAPQHPRTDRWTIPAAVLFQIGWFGVFFGGGLSPVVGPVIDLSLLILVAVLSTAMYFTPEVELHVREAVDTYWMPVFAGISGAFYLLVAAGWFALTDNVVVGWVVAIISLLMLAIGILGIPLVYLNNRLERGSGDDSS